MFDQRQGKQERGLIRLIVLIIIAILVLSYFRIDLRKLVNSDLTQANFQYLWGYIVQGWEWLLGLWQQYVSGPFFQTLDRYR